MAAPLPFPPGGIKIKFKRKRETGSHQGIGVSDEAMLESRESKRHAREDSPVPVSESGEPLEVFPGRGAQISSFPVVIKQKLDWFSLNSVHRMERQVVPEYFTGKSNDRTPKVYMELRNTIVRKYWKSPEKALSIADFQGLVNVEAKDLSRIFNFLDHWGIINYSAATSDPRNYGLSWAGAKAILQENTNGEVQISPASLMSVQSLIQFEAPRTKFRPEDVSSSSGCSSGMISDLDRQIQERLSERRCASCSHYCSEVFYQSQKEGDVSLCSECFSDGKPVIGMATVDFVRIDSAKDVGDLDADNWTDQETLLLLEALEIYHDNWNEIAEHVATKSKAQCILHFIRLPMEDGLLDNIDIPGTALTSHAPDKVIETGNTSLSVTKANGNCGGYSWADFESENRTAFANSGNPVMALVAFLASAVGPRVAAACAHAALVVLSKDDCAADALGDSSLSKVGYAGGDRLIPQNRPREDGKQDAVANSIQDRDHGIEKSQGLQTKNDITKTKSTLPPEKVKLAAMMGLSAAALKAKLFADQEERDIQRLAANIVSHQVERSRQRLSTERIRIMSSHFGSAGSSTLATGAIPVSAINNRPVIAASAPSAPHPGYGPSAHPAMPFMPRPAMFAYGSGGVGSSVPLSAIQPLSGGAPGSIAIGSTAANSNVPHSMLRPPTGNNTNAN